MGLWKRLFSADYRRAVAAEAAGEYSEAARAYALAGEHAKVAEMHLLRAERAASPEARLQELRAAVRWADPEEPEGRAARRRVARALVNWARQNGVVSESDRQVVREAAALFSESGDHAGAGESQELIGDDLAAAEAYQRAGELEKLESVLAREESRRKRAHRISDAYDEYELRYLGGERDRALEALRACVELATGRDGEGYRQKLDALEMKLLADSKVELRQAGRETLYVGTFPLTIGREAICQLALRDAGVSRRHCEILQTSAQFFLRDLDSKNGTFLGGVQVAGQLPLIGTSTIGVGEHCTLRVEVAPRLLAIEVAGGLDRGRRTVASVQPITLSANASLSFVEGRPRLSVEPGQPLLLNGVRAGPQVQLVHGDLVTVGGEQFEVL